MNKKGVLTTYMLIFVILSVGISLFLFTGENFEKYVVVGGAQLNLLNLYIEGDTDLYANVQTSQFALSESLFEVAEGGGVHERSKMGDYFYWQKGSKKCYPSMENIRKEIELKFSEKMEKSLDVEYDNSNYIVFDYIYNETYEFDLDNIIATHNVNLPIEISYPFDLFEFTNSILLVESIVDECYNNISCWNAKPVNFVSMNEGNTFKIEVTPPNMKDSLTGKKFVIKGAVDFEYNPLGRGSFEC